MEVIISQKSKLKELCKRYRVLQLFAFGSVVKNNMKPDSDIDFLVYFKNDLPLLEYADNYFEFIYDLEKLFGRKIDLVSGKAMKNPYFIKEIENTKRLIYDGEHQKIAI